MNGQQGFSHSIDNRSFQKVSKIAGNDQDTSYIDQDFDESQDVIFEKENGVTERCALS